MPTRPCCCTNAGDGHRCTHAWSLIILAKSSALARDWPQRKAVRSAYSTHLIDAQLHPPGTDAWPDLCTITMADDPRCPQCSKETNA